MAQKTLLQPAIRSAIVCGGGPAGLMTAILMAKFVPKVIVLERAPEPKPVGSGVLLQEIGLRVLRSVGLEQAVQARAQRIDRLVGHHGSRLALNVAYEADAPAYAVHRGVLHDVLLKEALRHNVDLRCGFNVSGLKDQGRVVVDLTSGKETEPVDFVVDALGWRSVIAMSELRPTRKALLPFGAMWANFDHDAAALDPRLFPANQLTQRYRYASQMAGVLPLGVPFAGQRKKVAFFWSSPVLQTGTNVPIARQMPLDVFKQEVLGLWPELEGLLAQLTDMNQMTFSTYAHRTMPRVSFGPRLAHVGDALKSTSPQLGQGATSSLVDAFALSQSLRYNSTDVGAALQMYNLARRNHIFVYQTMSRLFTPMYQSNSRVLSTLRDLAVPIASATAPTRRLMARMVSGTLVEPVNTNARHF